MKCDAVGIAQPGHQQLPSFALRVRPNDMPFARLRASAMLSKGRRVIEEIIRQVYGVAMNAVDHAVRAECQIVTPVAGAARRVKKEL